MARVEIVHHTDDLERAKGREVDADHVDVEFMIDGRTYKIDLSDENYRLLQATFAPCVAAGRRHRGGTAARSTSTPRRRDANEEVRAWGRQQGFKVADRGRVPAEVLDAYNRRDQTNGHLPAAAHRAVGTNPVWNPPAPPARPPATDPFDTLQAQYPAFVETIADRVDVDAGLAAALATKAEPAADPTPEPTPEPAPPTRHRPSTRREPSTERPKFPNKKAMNATIRQWCAERGRPISPRGAIPSDVMKVWKFENGEPILLDAK